jgi:hypothetical protein
MSEMHLGDKRTAILRVLVWGAILAAAILFWISVGVALLAWIS